MSLKCSGLFLSQFQITSPHLLASGDGTKAPTIVGDVYVHPSAKIHPTAKVIILNLACCRLEELSIYALTYQAAF